MMKITGLCKRFGELEALADASLDIASGSVTALIGPSGSGKSTLLRCLNLLEVPDSGSIAVGGRELVFHPHERPAKADVAYLRGRTGMVFQNFQLFPHLDALGNVTVGLRTVRHLPSAEARELARACLARVGLSAKEKSHPAQLSGGQQQRVAIARALAMAPDLLLCDEPTSALDPELAAEVVEVLAQLARDGTTMVMATHDLRLARGVAHRVCFLDHGNIVEDGPAADFFGAPRTDRAKAFLATLGADGC